MHDLHPAGQMQMKVHAPGRANREPNSFTGEERGPREAPERGRALFPTPVTWTMHQARPESFADHHSKAHQFWVSQTEVAQEHIVQAFTFELSKCELPEIRLRLLGDLRNVDEELAQRVADGLGMPLPDASPADVDPRKDLAPSDALSILENGPESFASRRLGLLVTDSVDPTALTAVTDAVGAVDSVRDAHVNVKIIGWTADAQELVDSAGVAPDAGWVGLGDAKAAVDNLGELRVWDRRSRPAARSDAPPRRPSPPPRAPWSSCIRPTRYLP